MTIDDFAIRFTIALGHALWQVAAIAAVALVAVKSGRLPASHRCAIHALALLISTLCLPITFGRLGDELSVATPIAEARSSTLPTSVSTSNSFTPLEGSTARQSATPALIKWQEFAPWVAALYAAGFGVMLVRLLVAVFATHNLRSRSELVTGGIWAETLDRLSGVAKPALAWSTRVAGPVIVGLFKPIILLPMSLATRLAPAQVEAVLAHELAHLRRYDHWLVVAQRLAEAVLFFHPAAWWLSRQISLDREKACDDLVLAAGCDPADYAEALLRCSDISADAEPPGQLQVAADGGSSSQLRSRVLRMLGQEERDSFRLGRMGWLLTASVVGIVALLAVGQLPSESQRLAAVIESGSEAEIEAAVESLVAIGPSAAPDMIPLLRTGKTDRPAIEVLTRLAPHPAVQELLVDELRTTRHGHYPLLLALGGSGNEAHAEFIASLYPKSSLGVIFALERILTNRPNADSRDESPALDALLAGFDQIPTEYWHALASAIERTGLSAAVPELTRRLADVDQNSEAFPATTTSRMIRAIHTLSNNGPPTSHSQTFSQGQIFHSPYDGPGAPITFSVDPPATNYVTALSASAVFETLQRKTKGPGFTIDGSRLILFNGLKAAPLWPDGFRPYPGPWSHWLTYRTHRGVLNDLLAWQTSENVQPGPGRGARQMEIPANGLVIATKDDRSLIVLRLRPTTGDGKWSVSISPQDPLHLLVSEAERLPRFTKRHSCSLRDIDSAVRDGALSLRSAHLTQLTPTLRQSPVEPVLTADFDGASWQLLVPGSKEFLIAESEQAWDDPEEAVAALRSGPHLTSLEDGEFYAFAVRMPDGESVAGVMEVDGVSADEEPPHVRLLHKFMATTRAHEVFSR